MTQVADTLARAQIDALIPHAGTMCLLDRVVAWDTQGIDCRSDSHRDPHNPLREGPGLPIEAGIEYAAQAMAVHGGLVGHGGAERHGYVAVLNRVTWAVDRLDGEAGELRVTAEALNGSEDGRQYAFCVESAGRALLWGEALVVLAPV